MITATELLEFLTKAHKLGANPFIAQNGKGYSINLYYDWHNSGESHSYGVFINKEGKSSWDIGDYEFYTMDGILNEKLTEQEQKRIKEQKRQELIESLTPEQRELLGV